MTKTRRKPIRLDPPIDVFYKCPKCGWIGYYVADRYYLQCANCKRVFGWRGKDRTVTKEVYDRRFKNI